MMTVKKAIEHLVWKYKNTWSPTEKDINSLNSIIDFVDEQHKEQFNDNQLFAKLYIYVYGQYLKYYRASVFDKEPQKELHKLLDKPLEEIIKDFVKAANEVETENKMKVSGISLEHKLVKTDSQLEHERGSFKMSMLEEEMTIEEAETQLTSLINLALNTYG